LRSLPSAWCSVIVDETVIFSFFACMFWSYFNQSVKGS
jgi:hypothetical protein